ncbi:MAG: trypsin-like serine protease [Phycisphaerales bacterium]
MSHAFGTRRHRVWGAGLAVVCALTAGGAASGADLKVDEDVLVEPAVRPIPQIEMDYVLDTGLVENRGSGRASVYETVVRVADAPWLRLKFADVTLAPGSAILVTSLKDGYSQLLDSYALEAWGNTSAYFNGDALRVEIIANPRTGKNRVVMLDLIAGLDAGFDTICGTTDDRVRSFDNRNGRGMPIGCSVWMIDDCARCFVTAGHCSTSSLQVIQFNVPLSLSNGTVQNPPPQDQYPVDVSSKQSVNGGTGNDWGYFGVQRNTSTGMTPYEAYGQQAYTLAAAAPAVSGQTIRITGYGTTSPANTLNQVQKTHTGPYVTKSGNLIRYAVDTTGGNSGSPVVDEGTGLAIGIHTHAGCSSGGGSNQGTAIDHPNFRAALASPRGVCTQGLYCDVNADRMVNFSDLNVVLSNYGQSGALASGDVTGDGLVNFADVNAVLNNWEERCN